MELAVTGLAIPGLGAPGLTGPGMVAPSLAVPGMVAPRLAVPGLVAPYWKVSGSVHQVPLVVGIEAWVFHGCCAVLKGNGRLTEKLRGRPELSVVRVVWFSHEKMKTSVKRKKNKSFPSPESHSCSPLANGFSATSYISFSGSGTKS